MTWLADGCGKVEWSRFATLAAQVHKSLTGEAIDPSRLIPERYRPAAEKPKPKTDEQKQHETQAGLMLLGQALEGAR